MLPFLYNPIWIFQEKTEIFKNVLKTCAYLLSLKRSNRKPKYTLRNQKANPNVKPWCFAFAFFGTLFILNLSFLFLCVYFEFVFELCRGRGHMSWERPLSFLEFSETFQFEFLIVGACEHTSVWIVLHAAWQVWLRPPIVTISSRSHACNYVPVPPAGPTSSSAGQSMPSAT